MARRLTESEKEEVIDYMRNIKAPEGGANFVDEGERMLMDQSIYRTMPLIEENFERFPAQFQDRVIRGGRERRARAEQEFMGASGGQLVSPNIRSGGLLSPNMPNIDFGIDQYARGQSDAMQLDRGVEPIKENNEGIFGEILGAMSGVAGKIAEKRGFTEPKTSPRSANQMISTQVGGTPINASNTLPNAPTEINNFPQRQNLTAGPFSRDNRNIMEVYDPDVNYTKYSPQNTAVSRMPTGIGVDPSLRRQILSSGPATVDPNQTATAAPISPGVDTSFDDASQLGFKQDGALGIRGDASQLAKLDDYPEAEIEEDLKDIINPAANVDYKRLAKALALGFNTLRLNPDQQLSQFLGKSIEQDRQLKISKTAADRYRKAGYGPIADALTAGEITGKEAFTAYSALTKSNFEILSPEKFKEIYGTDMPERYKDYIVLRNKATGDIEQIGSAGISIGDKIETEESKLRAKGFQTTVDEYSALGLQAKSSINAIEELRRLNKTGRIDLLSGPVRNLIPSSFLNDETQAYSAILSDLARSQRVAGSGSQSDKDVELLFQTAGSIAFNRPAREIALDALEKKTLINAKLSELARAYNGGRIDKAKFVKRENEILSESLFTDEQRSLISSLEKSTPIDSEALNKSFEGVPEEVVKEILTDKKFLDEFLSSTDEQRRRAVEQIEKDLKEQ